ncbi:MAG: hypothetical protein IPP99_10715 [Chitinophagaceae bacterium]|nr:hypothetical protein [Chitinophagaceae bacterium]
MFTIKKGRRLAALNLVFSRLITNFDPHTAVFYPSGILLQIFWCIASDCLTPLIVNSLLSRVSEVRALRLSNQFFTDNFGYYLIIKLPVFFCQLPVYCCLCLIFLRLFAIEFSLCPVFLRLFTVLFSC